MSKPSTTKKAPKTTKTKPSGVEWLGDIPEHWEVRRNLGIFDERQESNQPDAELLSVTITRGVIKQSEITTKKDSSNDDKSKYKVIKKGDLAYNKMRAWQGALGISAYDGICSPAYIVLTPKNPKLSKYFHYLFRTPMFIEEANRLSYGLCDDMNTLRYEHFKTSYSPIPPDDELDKIVAFLDRKTSQIDALIEKKQRLLKLLDEQLAIKINNAVTKGIVNAQYGTLNPHLSTKTTPIYTTHTSPLKKSGIEWIGEIPEEWESIRLKRCVSQQDYGLSESSTTEGEYTYLGMGQIKNRKVIPNGANRLDKCPIELTLEENDLLYNRTNSLELVGKTGIFRSTAFEEPNKVTFASYLVRLRPSKLTGSKWLNYLMSDIHYLTTARSLALPSLHQANLTFGRVGVIKVPLSFSLSEQENLTHYLDQQISAQSYLTKKVNTEIKTLRILKENFISSTVTGKNTSL